jgi:NADPH2:quinone reductase
MRALTFDPAAPQGLALADVPDPVPGDGQALVAVRAVALNFGELAYLAQSRQPGEVPGWDAAGTVLRPAADGTGPAEGTPVVTFGWAGAWAQLRAADVAELAAVPDGVDLGQASALPVAAVTALRALRRLGPVVGRRVLVTGASGGVGRFAVQLAARAGAHVIAAVGSPARGEGLPALGADEVIIALDELAEPVFGVLENVGGPLLAEALTRTAGGGRVVSIGQASQQPTTIDFEAQRHLGGNRAIEPFTVGAGFGPDLGYLAGLLARGELDPQIGWRSSWRQAGDAAAALLGRQVRGKAVLDLD